MDVEEALLEEAIENAGEVGQPAPPVGQGQALQPPDNRAEVEFLRRSLVRAEQDAAVARERMAHFAAQLEKLQQPNVVQPAPQPYHPAPGLQGQPPAEQPPAQAEGTSMFPSIFFYYKIYKYYICINNFVLFITVEPNGWADRRPRGGRNLHARNQRYVCHY